MPRGTVTLMSEPDANQVREFVVVDKADRDALIELAKSEGVTATEIDEDDFVDPATASFILLGASAAVGTVVYLLEVRKGGQVFDNRPKAPRPEYRSKDIAYGYVKIVAPDGKVTVEVKEPKGLIGQVIDAVKEVLVETVGKPAQTVGEAVSSAVEAVAGRESIDITIEKSPTAID